MALTNNKISKTPVVFPPRAFCGFHPRRKVIGGGDVNVARPSPCESETKSLNYRHILVKTNARTVSRT